jgi:hypothetical protein
VNSQQEIELLLIFPLISLNLSRMKGKLLLSVWLSFLLHLASAKFNVEKSSLRVTSPESLKDVYESAIGNFGVPKYGGTLHGVVVYPKSNLKACKSFDDFDISFKPKAGDLPVFLLVDRGGKCSTRFGCFYD